MTFDVATIRKDFPVLHRLVNDKPLVYLDSANTSQKPQVVIDALSTFMETGYAPINRSAYQLAAEATDAFEATRSALATFINAPKANEVVFTKNATEALNLVIMSWGRANLKAGDAVLLTHMEHHANIVPWHMLVAERGIQLRWVPLTSDGQLDLTNLDELLKDVKAFSFTSMSNVLGTINPVQRLCVAAHKAGAIAIVDACQSVPHQPTDVQAWGADLVAFSSHKMCGPSGIGMLWGRLELLDAMPPFLGGGEMIESVSFLQSTWREPPWRFEAGTPPIAQAIGLAAACRYLDSIGLDHIAARDAALTAALKDALASIPGLRIVGPPNDRGSLVSFVMEQAHPHDLVTFAGEKGLCLRGGHHCTQPLMRKLALPGTARASLYFYNSFDEIEAAARILADAGRYFA